MPAADYQPLKSPLAPPGGDRQAAPTQIRWLVFALGCGTSWFLYLHRYTFNFIKQPLVDEYGLSETSVGTIFGLFNFTYGFGQLPSGLACDFLGTHLFLSILIVGWSLMLAGFAGTSNYYALGGMRLLFGASQAGAYPILSKVTRNWFPKSIRTTVQGFIATFCGRLGGAMSPIIMATLLMGVCGLSWRVALSIMAGAGVIFGIAFLVLFRETPQRDARVNEAERELIAEGSVEEPAQRGVLPFRQALRNRSLFFLALQQLLAAGADNIYQFLLASFFLERFGVNVATAGLLVSLPMFGGALGGLAAGWLNDFVGRRLGNRWGRTCVGFAGPVVAAGLLFPFLRQETPWAAAIALLFVKFFVDWTQPTVWGACTDLGGRYTATVFSLINTAGTIGGVIFPPLFGLILDRYKTQAVVDGETLTRLNYDPLFVVIALMYVGSALCWFLIDSNQTLKNKE